MLNEIKKRLQGFVNPADLDKVAEELNRYFFASAVDIALDLYEGIATAIDLPDQGCASGAEAGGTSGKIGAVIQETDLSQPD